MRAYRRRRGWLAWHVALLGRVDNKHFPELAELTGEAPVAQQRGQSQAQLLHNVKLWKAVLRRHPSTRSGQPLDVARGERSKLE